MAEKYAKSTLMSWNKKELVSYILDVLYHNIDAVQERNDNQFNLLKSLDFETETVRHGCWAEKKYSGGIFNYSFICSECHKETPTGAFPISPDYCPFCGAKMDLEEN